MRKNARTRRPARKTRRSRGKRLIIFGLNTKCFMPDSGTVATHTRLHITRQVAEGPHHPYRYLDHTGVVLSYTESISIQTFRSLGTLRQLVANSGFARVTIMHAAPRSLCYTRNRSLDTLSANSGLQASKRPTLNCSDPLHDTVLHDRDVASAIAPPKREISTTRRQTPSQTLSESVWRRSVLGWVPECHVVGAEVSGFRAACTPVHRPGCSWPIPKRGAAASTPFASSIEYSLVNR
eukprot:COSAG02_NODE_2601_length_8448_cov_37.777339_1_plen_237_part_00